MKKRYAKSCCTQAFTLIEVLVVISIISLLMAVMMPALSKAKRLSRRMVCSSNLKQISFVIHAYAADNNDLIIPASEMTFNIASMQDFLSSWHFALLPYIGQTLNTSDVLDNKADLWFCPEDKDPYPRGFYNNPHDGMASYALNGYKQDASETTPAIKFGPAGGFKFAEIRQPSLCMLMCETSYASHIYDNENPNLAKFGLLAYGHHRQTSGFFHQGKMNVLKVDASCSSIRGIKCERDEQYIPANYPAKGFQFWPELRLKTSAEDSALWGPGY